MTSKEQDVEIIPLDVFLDWPLGEGICSNECSKEYIERIMAQREAEKEGKYP